MKVEAGGKGWGKTVLTMRTTLDEAVNKFWNIGNVSDTDVDGEADKVVVEQMISDTEVRTGYTTGFDRKQWRIVAIRSLATSFGDGHQ